MSTISLHPFVNDLDWNNPFIPEDFPWDTCRGIYSQPNGFALKFLKGKSAQDFSFLVKSGFIDAKNIMLKWLKHNWTTLRQLEIDDEYSVELINDEADLFEYISIYQPDISFLKSLIQRGRKFKGNQFFLIISVLFLSQCSGLGGTLLLEKFCDFFEKNHPDYRQITSKTSKLLPPGNRKNSSLELSWVDLAEMLHAAIEDIHGWIGNSSLQKSSILPLPILSSQDKFPLNSKETILPSSPDRNIASMEVEGKNSPKEISNVIIDQSLDTGRSRRQRKRKNRFEDEFEYDIPTKIEKIAPISAPITATTTNTLTSNKVIASNNNTPHALLQASQRPTSAANSATTSSSAVHHSSSNSKPPPQIPGPYFAIPKIISGFPGNNLPPTIQDYDADQPAHHYYRNVIGLDDQRSEGHQSSATGNKSDVMLKVPAVNLTHLQRLLQPFPYQGMSNIYQSPANQMNRNNNNNNNSNPQCTDLLNHYKQLQQKQQQEATSFVSMLRERATIFRATGATSSSTGSSSSGPLTLIPNTLINATGSRRIRGEVVSRRQKKNKKLFRIHMIDTNQLTSSSSQFTSAAASSLAALLPQGSGTSTASIGGNMVGPLPFTPANINTSGPTIITTHPATASSVNITVGGVTVPVTSKLPLLPGSTASNATSINSYAATNAAANARGGGSKRGQLLINQAKVLRISEPLSMKGVVSLSPVRYRVQLNAFQNEKRKFSRNCSDFYEAAWIFEITLLISDSPANLDLQLKVGNFYPFHHYLGRLFHVYENIIEYYVELGRQIANFHHYKDTFPMSLMEIAIRNFDNLKLDELTVSTTEIQEHEEFLITEHHMTSSSIPTSKISCDNAVDSEKGGDVQIGSIAWLATHQEADTSLPAIPTTNVAATMDQNILNNSNNNNTQTHRSRHLLDIWRIVYRVLTEKKCLKDVQSTCVTLFKDFPPLYPSPKLLMHLETTALGTVDASGDGQGPDEVDDEEEEEDDNDGGAVDNTYNSNNKDNGGKFSLQFADDIEREPQQQHDDNNNIINGEHIETINNHNSIGHAMDDDDGGGDDDDIC
jgi:hypothetical protein